MKKIFLASCLMAAMAFAQGTVPNTNKFADVDYVGDRSTYHKLDIYVPTEAKESYPVVIHTYGSAWSQNNSKGSADLNTICAAYARAGYAVVTPNHRSASDGIYPAALHDIKAVVRFVRGNAAKYKFDTTFIAVSGFSSGGHLSSLVATTCGLTEGKSGSVTVDLVGDLGEYTSLSSCADAAVLWSPPTDIYTMNPINNFIGSGTCEGAFIGVEREGHKDEWMVASSPYYASDDDPPVIMFHGTSDQVVKSKELYDSLKNHNVVTEFITVQNGTHGGDKMYATENLQKAVAFLDQAREAKAAVVVPPDTMKQDTAKQDTTKQDTTKQDTTVQDTTKKDTLITSIPVLRSLASGPVTYRVFSLDGTLVMKSSSLDLSRLKPGVYYVESATRNGSRRVFRYAKR